MKLSYTNCETLTIAKIEPIDELFEGTNIREPIWFKDFMPSPIIKVVIGVRYNCCDNVYLETEISCEESGDDSFGDCEYDSEYITIDTDNQTFTLNTEFFTVLHSSHPDYIIDGVYTVTISIYYEDGSFYEEENCIFVDCQTACKLSKYIAQNLGTSKATELAMVHFALTEAANCECSCEDLCTLFEYLWNNLSTIQITSHCGC